MKKNYFFVMLMMFSALVYAQNKTAEVAVSAPHTDLSLIADVPVSSVPTAIAQNFTGKATCSYSGSLTATSLSMTNRLFRDAVPSTCAAPKAFPGTLSTTVFYLVHSIPNNTGSEQCVTISATTAGASAIHFTAYKGSFDPTNLATNYLADSGSSATSGSTVTFEAKIPSGQNLVIVANANAATATGDYTMQVTGLNCLALNCVKNVDITTVSPMMTKRLYRDGVPSVCATAKAYPGDFSANVYYRTLKVTNNTGASKCITVTGTLTDPVGSGVHISAYNGSFVPSNLATNYMADSGTSAVSGTPQSLGVTVPAGATITLVLNTNATGDTMTAPITVTVDGVDCSVVLASGEVAASSKNTALYPNPTTSVLNVKGLQIKTVQIYDASGKAAHVNYTANTIDTHKLAPGVYSLQITDTDGNVVFERFIKK
ncbi:MAG: T9SS type A sorting domain-containing protein [Chryseobacterium sp.]|nr:T9SS type A sorting domain-containing protein [Chryseobacterium sp.]